MDEVMRYEQPERDATSRAIWRVKDALGMVAVFAKNGKDSPDETREALEFQAEELREIARRLNFYVEGRSTEAREEEIDG